jgi:hypothetical protein
MFFGLFNNGVSLRAEIAAGWAAGRNASRQDFSAALQNQHIAQRSNPQPSPYVGNLNDFHAVQAVQRAEQRREASLSPQRDEQVFPRYNPADNGAGYTTITATQIGDRMVAHLPEGQQQTRKQEIAAVFNGLSKEVGILRNPPGGMGDFYGTSRELNSGISKLESFDTTGSIASILRKAHDELVNSVPISSSIDNYEKSLAKVKAFLQGELVIDHPPPSEAGPSVLPSRTAPPRADYTTITVDQVNDRMVAHVSSAEHKLVIKQQIATEFNTIAGLVNKLANGEIEFNSPAYREATSAIEQGIANLGSYDSSMGNINIQLGWAYMDVGVKTLFSPPSKIWSDFQQKLDKIAPYIETGVMPK